MTSNSNAASTELTQEEKDFFYTSVKEIKEDLQCMSYTISSEDLQVALLYGPYSKEFRMLINWYSTKISTTRVDRDIEIVEMTDNIPLFTKQFRKFMSDIGGGYSFLKSGDIIMNIKTFGQMYMLFDFMSVQLKAAYLWKRQQAKEERKRNKASIASKIRVKKEPKPSNASKVVIRQTFSESQLDKLTDMFEDAYNDYSLWREGLIKDLDDTLDIFARATNGRVPSKIKKMRRKIKARPDVKMKDALVAASILTEIIKRTSNEFEAEREKAQNERSEMVAEAGLVIGNVKKETPSPVKASVEHKIERVKSEDKDDDERELERYEFQMPSQFPGIDYGTLDILYEEYEDAKKEQNEQMQKSYYDGGREGNKESDVEATQSLGCIKYENIPTVFDRLGSKVNEDGASEEYVDSCSGARMQGLVGSLTYNGFPSEGLKQDAVDTSTLEEGRTASGVQSVERELGGLNDHTDQDVEVQRTVERSGDGENLLIKCYAVGKDGGDLLGEKERSTKDVNPKEVLPDEGGRVGIESIERSLKDQNDKIEPNEMNSDEREECVVAGTGGVRKLDEDTFERRKKMKTGEEIAQPDPLDTSFSNAVSDVDYRAWACDVDYRTWFSGNNPWTTYNFGNPNSESSMTKNYRGIDAMLEERQLFDQDEREPRGELEDQ